MHYLVCEHFLFYLLFYLVLIERPPQQSLRHDIKLDLSDSPDRTGCFATGRDTSVSGRMQTSGLPWEAGEPKVDISAWYSSPSTFLNSWKTDTQIHKKLKGQILTYTHSWLGNLPSHKCEDTKMKTWKDTLKSIALTKLQGHCRSYNQCICKI